MANTEKTNETLASAESNEIFNNVSPAKAKIVPEKTALIKATADSTLADQFNIDQPTADRPVMFDGASIKDNTKIHRLLEDEIPDSVLRRYAIRGHLYYSKDRTKGLAFEDKGKFISAISSEADDVRAMIEIAKAKNWSAIKISGTEAFKKEVWLAASIQGLAVEGYKPSLQEFALLEDTKRLMQNKIEVATDKKQFTQQDKTQTTAKTVQKEVELAVDKAGADKSVQFKYTPTAAEAAIIATAKAKGASPKLQASMKQKLAVAVNQLKAMGIEIPKPKVYDTKAPSIGNKSPIVGTDGTLVKKHFAQPQVAPRR